LKQQKGPDMGYRILNHRDSKWQARKGLEGPFFYPNGMALYYDPKEGAYWDPTTDFYLSNDEMDTINQQIFTALAH
jgi:hypothetical protein